MQCFFHSKSDEPDSCLLGGKHTACGTYKCFLTIGETCTTGHEAKLKGTECAKSLVCGKFVENLFRIHSPSENSVKRDG